MRAQVCASTSTMLHSEGVACPCLILLRLRASALPEAVMMQSRALKRQHSVACELGPKWVSEGPAMAGLALLWLVFLGEAPHPNLPAGGGRVSVRGNVVAQVPKPSLCLVLEARSQKSAIWRRGG